MGWSAGRHVDHPCGGGKLRHGLLEKSLKKLAARFFQTILSKPQSLFSGFFVTILFTTQKRSGDPNPQYFSKSTAVQMGGVLPYKCEAYCSTNGRRIAGFPFLRSLEARKVQRYKWGAYCRTNSRLWPPGL